MTSYMRGQEICQLGVELTDEFMKHESEKGKV